VVQIKNVTVDVVATCSIIVIRHVLTVLINIKQSITGIGRVSLIEFEQVEFVWIEQVVVQE